MKTGSALIIGITIICVTLTGCNKSDFPHVPYPRVETLPVSDISVDGATVNARISSEGDEAVTGYGFEWKLQKKNAIINTITLTYGNEPEMLTYVIRSGLLADSTYSVTAFIVTSHYKVYGEHVLFISKGCKFPVIKSLTPAEGTYDDIVTITGKHFNDVRSKNSVKFNDISAEILTASKTTLTVKVPQAIRQRENNIKVTINLQSSNNNFIFSILSPEVYSLSDLSGYIGNSIHINGYNFNPDYL